MLDLEPFLYTCFCSYGTVEHRLPADASRECKCSVCNEPLRLIGWVRQDNVVIPHEKLRMAP